MLENKRERLKTFLRKIDEKAIVRIKHFMKERDRGKREGTSQLVMEREKGLLNQQGAVADAHCSEDLESSYPVESSGGGLPAKVKKSRSSSSNGSIKKLKSRKAMSMEAFIKHNKTFHKLFPEISQSEDLIHAYICALQKEVPYHGRLYITDTNALKKQNTALLVPNALSIRTTEGDKYLFVSLRNRESCYQLLRSVSPQLEDGSTNSSPVFSSTENSFDKCKLENSSESSLDNSFDQCDGSESQSLQDQPLHGPHREAVPKENVPAFGNLNRQQSDSSSFEELSVSGSGGSWVWNVTEKAKSLLVQREADTLNTLLFIYLILVVLLLLSSGYIGLRIVALEEQLTSLGALSEFTLQSGYQDT
ncbi:hypothetical protein FQN60_012839 [Etheostoma spectabile]|uniref:GRAM domain-containing protein n=1 Tax=Etheostoma spectabile TaxID=54343 RepID=A0A5J5D7W2_9PERO|nr:hypothetical protein FQN60_012839 [Etheostoma spectabile]